MIGRSRKRQEIHTGTRTIILTYKTTRLPTHNALIPATGTVTIAVYFKKACTTGQSAEDSEDQQPTNSVQRNTGLKELIHF